MATYVFESTRYPDTKAFTVDRSGANLPEKYGPWQSSGSGSAIAAGQGANVLETILAREGYFIAPTRRIL